MKPTPWFTELLSDRTPGTVWDAREDIVLRLCVWFAGQDDCAAYAIASADAFIQADACTPANTRALFFALEKTGDEKYREAIRCVMAKLDAQPDAALDLMGAYETLPFRMAYEMKLNGMEKVGATAAMFRDVHVRMWDKKDARHAASLREEAWFLLGLVDAIAVCSDQLYEHWRAMVDIYRVTLKGLLPLLEEADARTRAILLCALQMGVEMGLIDPERYQPIVRKGVAALYESGEDKAAALLEEGTVTK